MKPVWLGLLVLLTNSFVAAEPFDYNHPQVKTVESHGSPANKVDLFFLSDGYTAFEKDLFQADIQSACRYLWG
jgi:hypothetical protein